MQSKKWQIKKIRNHERWEPYGHAYQETDKLTLESFVIINYWKSLKWESKKLSKFKIIMWLKLVKNRCTE